MVIITARVHPGETVASYMLDGVLKALLHPTDKRAAALRSHFQFKIIPILNPDGVYNGHFRLDSNGINLNRCYIAPEKERFPSIYAVKTYVEYLSSYCQLEAYFDLHGHSSKRGCFLFGNALQAEDLVETRLFARLVHINSSFFEYSECDFSEKSMISKDPKDEHSKEGSGRVSVYRLTGLKHCYTVECNANIGRLVHPLSPLVNTVTGKRYNEVTKGKLLAWNPRDRGVPAFEEVGAGLLWALLDLEGWNPFSRLPSSDHMTLQGVREWVKTTLLTESRTRTNARRLKSSVTGGNESSPEEETKQRKSLVKASLPPSVQSRFPSLLQAGSRRHFMGTPGLPKYRPVAGRL